MTRQLKRLVLWKHPLKKISQTRSMLRPCSAQRLRQSRCDAGSGINPLKQVSIYHAKNFYPGSSARKTVEGLFPHYWKMLILQPFQPVTTSGGNIFLGNAIMVELGTKGKGNNNAQKIVQATQI